MIILTTKLHQTQTVVQEVEESFSNQRSASLIPTPPVEVFLSTTLNPQSLLMYGLVPCMAATAIGV